MNQVSRVCASAVASAPDPGTQLPSGPGKRGTASFGHGWENPTGDPPGCRNRFPSQRKEEWLHDVCACDGGPWSINNPVPVKRRKNRCIIGGRNRGFQQGHQGTGEVIKLIMRGGGTAAPSPGGGEGRGCHRWCGKRFAMEVFLLRARCLRAFGDSETFLLLLSRFSSTFLLVKPDWPCFASAWSSPSRNTG